MKSVFVLLFAISFHFTFGCSYAPYSFCETSQSFQGNNIICGKIIDTIPHGIRLKIINVIRGIENRDTIIVWNGTDFDCNGPFSMAASLMGNVDDTILTVMNMIGVPMESWQITGDYVRPDYFGYVPEVWVHNDTIIGFIAGHAFSPPQYQVWRLSFNDWLLYWNNNGNSCNTLMGISENENDVIMLVPNPANSSLYLKETTETIAVKIYSAESKLVLNSVFTNNQLDVSSLPNGVYYAELFLGKKKNIRKFIKLD